MKLDDIRQEVGLPPWRTSRKKDRVSCMIRIDVEDAKKIILECEEQSISLSQWINDAVKARLKVEDDTDRTNNS